jgi:hypothetical protein
LNYEKNIFLSIALVCVALVTTLSINSKANKHINPLVFANIEALSENESTQLWIRKDYDCEYKFSGKVGSYVSFTLGASTLTIRIGADGTATYTYPDGKTTCTAGGNEQCTARYCPPLIL